MQITDEDVAQILKIIDSSNLSEVRLESNGLVLHVSRGNLPPEASLAAAPAAAAPAAPQPAAQPAPQAAPQPAQQPAAPAPAGPQPVLGTTPSSEVEMREGWHGVRSPMLGTFYRSPSPGAPPFIEVDDKVEADDTVCLIEVMKLFNSIKAGVAGRVVAIHADNSALVEYDQILIVIDTNVS